MNKFRQLRCSFCGKKETEVLKLVAGLRGYICDKCVAIASRIMNDAPDANQPPGVKPSMWRNLLTRAQQFLGGQARRVGSYNASS
ncbi:MAG: ClpX C4-type zinc finger protein [Acidobacteriota bacterium]|nr:ClpX C4-type zinc finger protein [Acidobacteriota bacterium]